MFEHERGQLVWSKSFGCPGFFDGLLDLGRGDDDLAVLCFNFPLSNLHSL